MYRIKDDGTLIISKGDSFSVPLFINVGTKEAPIRLDLSVLPSASIYLGVYAIHSSFENSIVRKKFTVKDINEKGDIIVNFKREDTIYLNPGNYYYEVKLRLKNEKDGEFIRTVIGRKLCQIV